MPRTTTINDLLGTAGWQGLAIAYDRAVTGATYDHRGHSRAGEALAEAGLAMFALCEDFDPNTHDLEFVEGYLDFGTDGIDDEVVERVGKILDDD